MEKFNIDAKSRFGIMQFSTSLLSSLLLASFILAIKKEFGFLSAVILLVTTLYSQWLVIFARNLYWVFYTILAPFCFSWIFLQFYQNKREFSKYIYWGICFLIFIKSLCGFEYLSTIFISFGIPFIYFALKNNWTFKNFIKRGILVYIYAFLGFLSAVIIHLIQKIFILGSLKASYDALIFTILKRTYGDPNKFSDIYQLNRSIAEVLDRYWNSKLFELSFSLGHLKIIFSDIAIFFIYVSIVFILCLLLKIINKQNIKKINCLLLSTWISVLAPLSWFVLAKGHSYIHTHMNHVLWYLPFLFFVFVFFGYFLSSIFYIKSKKSGIIIFTKVNKKKIILIFLIVLAMNFISIFIDSKIQDKEIKTLLSNNLTLFQAENGLKISINEEKNELIYYHKDCKDKDLSTKFFLHFYPEDRSSLPENNKTNFLNMDFAFVNSMLKTPKFSRYRNYCIVSRKLPNFKIKNINTGQYNSKERIWETNIKMPVFLNIDSLNKVLENSSQIFQNDDLKVFINKNNLIYFYPNCKDKDLSIRFFLHFYPEDRSSLPENNKHGFLNMDFNFSNFQENIKYIKTYENSCLALRALPAFEIQSLNTGQYNSKGRTWETKILSLDNLDLSENSLEIHAYNLSDNQWQNGISKNQAAFFIKNNFLDRQNIKIGDQLKFFFSGIRKIKNITYINAYINIFVDGEKLDPIKDGYPNKIEVLR